jgi:hypothetical protein
MGAKVRERLAVNKQRSQRFNTERLNLKKVNDVKIKCSVVLGSQIGLKLWKIWTLRWILIVLGKVLINISISTKESPCCYMYMSFCFMLPHV